MRFSLFVALRYLFSKKSTNAINIISGISMAGMTIAGIVLVVLLSVFNGFENTILSLYNNFYTDLQISPQTGKTFIYDEELLQKIETTEGIKSYSFSLSENVYFEYEDHDYIGSLKGVDSNYLNITALDSFIVDGEFILKDTSRNFVVIGAGIAVALGTTNMKNIYPIKIHVPKRTKMSSTLPSNLFNVGFAYPAGVFNLQQEINTKYVFTNLGFIQNLLSYPRDEIGAIEIKLKKGYKLNEVQKELGKKIPEELKLLNRFQQQAALYRVMKTEKWTVFAILSFIMFVISFNILGALSMLVIEKQKDISVLKVLGADNGLIQRIFFTQGLSMSLIGGVIGISIGLLIALAQIKFGFIKIPGSENFIIDAYPVKIKFMDILYVLIAISGISALASIIPSRRASRFEATFREN